MLPYFPSTSTLEFGQSVNPKENRRLKVMVSARGFTRRRFIALEVEVGFGMPVEVLNYSAMTIPTTAGNGPCRQGISLHHEAATTP